MRRHRHRDKHKYLRNLSKSHNHPGFWVPKQAVETTEPKLQYARQFRATWRYSFCPGLCKKLKLDACVEHSGSWSKYYLPPRVRVMMPFPRIFLKVLHKHYMFPRNLPFSFMDTVCNICQKLSLLYG